MSQIEITTPSSGKTHIFEKFVHVKDVVTKLEEFTKFGEPLVAVYVNSVIQSFSHVLKTKKCTMEPVLSTSFEGRALYADTISFILQMAIERVIGVGNAMFTVEYQMGNGFFCTLRNFKGKLDE